MSTVKNKILEEIDKKIEKHKQAKKRAAQNHTVESYVLELINNIEEVRPMVSNEIEWKILAKQAVISFEQRMKSIDPMCQTLISWHEPENRPPQVYSVKIKWSKYYINRENCDAEINIDITELIFR